MPPRWASASSTSTACIAIFVVVLLVGRLPGGRCQSSRVNSLPPFPAPSQLIGEVNDLTMRILPIMKSRFDFCIKDVQQDWDQTFNYTSDKEFLMECHAKTPDMSGRLCTAAEVKFYFDSFIESEGNTNYMKPNINCNSTSWVPGCEPGWASSVSPPSPDVFQYKDSTALRDIPPRVHNSQPCCAGFYCPLGITCMIPCPLGAYCPLAKHNETTGLCDPYKYQLPPSSRNPNHTCGGADIWADVEHSSELFCPAGYFCPSTIVKNNCSSGHYCRMGSIYETSCYKSSTCDANSETQNITILGGLLMGALILLLLIIYNFSDQILAYRKRRQAKSREAAARVAREAVQARERWKVAKNIAARHAVELQKSISRTFSRRRSNRLPEQHKVIGLSWQSSDASPSEIEEVEMLGTAKHSSEKDCDDAEVLHSNPEKKPSKKNTTKGKHQHTRTQIFKYAYSEIEKEKILQQEKNNLNFSGVISLATKSEVRRRPVIEITFKDLTLVLKRNKKQLLKSVTGELIPGHVTAIMGPSGAGKTTFLTALTGKTAGCQMTGLVLINGKVEPIHSYKKIIGFVPQDDIVHGNLTVHENLWFSAHCRLAADISKANKVLIVERTIESLGLQAVRDSLVGTVEKRGISGGQKKRVNVGLEMVMEPSLLILDEPTSGLDSSSSLLLMRALRREALEGVNVCMVVHQPSYTLFSMFDDLILLAKGGLIAYQGPVRKVEEYFAGLEIEVPERVNPPDYFIDILEGIVKPSTSTDVKSNHLPLIWMLHNGYNVPRDMQDELDSVSESFRGGARSSRSGLDVESGATGVQEDVKERDHLEQNFLKSKDLTNRKTPGKLKQYRYYLGRVTKQRLREATAQAVDYLILGLAGVCLGILAKANDSNLGAASYTYATIAVSLLGQIGALRSFSTEKLQYLRERRSGMSSLAYFLARDTVDHFNTVVKPVVFLSMFYFFSNPRSSFADNYIIFLALVYCVTGIGYTFAICFQPGSAQLWSALLPVVLTLIATQRKNSRIPTYLCYPKWALEAFVIVNAKRYSGVWIVTRCGLLEQFHYNINNWGLCLGILFLYGFIFRCVAFVCLVLLNKK